MTSPRAPTAAAALALRASHPANGTARPWGPNNKASPKRAVTDSDDDDCESSTISGTTSSFTNFAWTQTGLRTAQLGCCDETGVA